MAVGVAAAILSGMADRWIYIQTVVLTLTLGVVSYYTFLTRRTVKAIERQTNVGIIPVISLKLVSASDYLGGPTKFTKRRQTYLEVTNVGNGTALNVKISLLWIKGVIFSARFHDLGEPLWFENIPTLGKGSAIPVTDTGVDDVDLGVHGPREDILSFLRPEKARGSTKLLVWFTDLLGTQYLQAITFSRDGISSGPVSVQKEVIRNTFTYNGTKYE